MRSGVGMKLCHVHPESDTVKRLGHRREKVELLPPGPVWKADFVQERSPHSATGADGFRSIAVVLVLPADTEGKRPPILSPQRGKSDKGSGNRTDAQIANQTMAVLLHKAVAPWFMIFEPVEILPDVSFRL